MNLTELRTLRRALQAFNDKDKQMQIATALTLVEVAYAEMTKEKMVVRDLEKKVGLSSASATRNAYYWEGGYKGQTGGYNFVEMRTDHEDRRSKTLHLTHEGRAFIERIGV